MSSTSTVQAAASGTGAARAPVTVIGLGMMGRVLAQAFLAAGHPTTVWNRTPGKEAVLLEAGAFRAATISEAVAASPLVVVCLTTHAAVHEALDPVGTALRGRTLVNLTSGIPEQARELADWATSHGAEYLDGAIMAIPDGIGRADSVLLYSGPAGVFEAHKATLQLLGGRTTYLGEGVTLAALHDVVLLSAMYTVIGGFLHAVALFETAGSRAETFMPLITNTLTTTVSWLPEIAREVEERAYETDVSSLDINKEGVRMIVQASKAQGINADLLGPLQTMIDRRVAAGYGRQGLASLIEEIRGSMPAATVSGQGTV